jgi:ankyrin repeat protein
MSQEVDDRVALVVLELLLHKYSEAMRSMRIGDWSLLHLAARMESPRAAEICRLVIQALPELVLERDANGLQPLHLACLGGNSPVVKCILEILPDAIRVVTLGGAFPIHYAVDALYNFPEAAVEMVKALLAVDPGVASQVHGSHFPLFIACTKTNGSNFWKGLKVIELLYDTYPEAIVTAKQTFRHAIDISRFVDVLRDFIVEQLRYVAQASNLQLVRTQDEYGMLPLHHALEEDLGCSQAICSS